MKRRRIKSGRFKGMVWERVGDRYAAAFKKGVRVTVHGSNGDTIYRVKDVAGKLRWERLRQGANGEQEWEPHTPDYLREPSG